MVRSAASARMESLANRLTQGSLVPLPVLPAETEVAFGVTTSTTPRWLPTALCAAALALLPLGLVSCGTDVVEPETNFVEAIQAAVNKAHEAHDDQGSDTLDDIEAAAYEQIDAALEAGDITEEDARNLRAWVAEKKRVYVESVRAGRRSGPARDRPGSRKETRP